MVPRFTKSRRSTLTRKPGNQKIAWQPSLETKQRVLRLLEGLNLEGFNPERIYTFSSKNAKTRATARIWGLSRVWQQALRIKPAYIIETISEKYDHLKDRQKDEVLLHELAHIPKNFSGALVPHRRGKGHFHDKLRKMLSQYQNK